MSAAFNTAWSKKLAYLVGLITADGCLSKDGRHIDFTSKDKELVLILTNSLNLKNKIGMKSRAKENIKKYYRVQIGGRIRKSTRCYTLIYGKRSSISLVQKIYFDSANLRLNRKYAKTKTLNNARVMESVDIYA